MNMMAPSLPRPRDDIYTTLKRLGLASGLHICLDAGDGTSAPASTTKWTDLSGGGNGFWRGVDATSEATLDMDFVGTVGRRDKDTYWANDGGAEIFTFEKATTTPLVNAHKDNQTWSYFCWYYVGTLASDHYLLSTATVAAVSGISLRISSANLLRLFIGNGSATPFYNADLTNSDIVAGWNFVGIAIDITSGALTANVRTGNRRTEGALTTTGSPSSAANATAPRMFVNGSSATKNPAGERINSACFWAGAKLSVAQYEAIFQATRSKFGV